MSNHDLFVMCALSFGLVWFNGILANLCIVLLYKSLPTYRGSTNPALNSIGGMIMWAIMCLPVVISVWFLFPYWYYMRGEGSKDQVALIAGVYFFTITLQIIALQSKGIQIRNKADS